MKLKFLLPSLALFLITACGMKPMESDFSFIKTDMQEVTLEKLGNSTILLYNGAAFMHKIDNTSAVNIWIDNKPLAQLRASEYVIINLASGPHHLKVLHKDMFNMNSEHDITIDNDTKVIEIKPTVTSNSVETTNELPKKFEKFKYSAR